ncbi:BirA family transcriptional regulator, biotin operon repressor / biotin-[acetyl-CoA-carboxylase] ligase [Formosa sp. Hel1_31_208]|uniref:biotin--[acetyl-CoA-carboxylase] ligase n=1 Tax=Formosa sp. Hel1_31_208 TaxID=1798225 RepID=UPI00087C679E|nr:biotin--[acetyl-CoA-carboxylase] ligase [Formosa sp. Hel1_31_208]SDS08447.1 BirA family transcriptional regulator, biotin operon repressor / biotin-[acetyl-CoA-carboxylase] ligase [Formosa sp. Hel1_31_208]
MRIIKLSAIDSTNTFLRQLSAAEVLSDFTVVVAESQLKGRGQMGTTWTSQPSKNLICSVFVDVSYLNIEHSFYISMAVSLAISSALKSFQIKKVKVKWPNDILADQKKISGILIENVIKNNQLQGSIIGFGLNVNQTQFNDLALASSMQIVSGKSFDLDEVLQRILKYLKVNMSLLRDRELVELKKRYEQELFRKNKPSTFKNAERGLFSGFIKGVTDSGHLQILVEDNRIMVFQLKEVQLLY